MADAAGGADGTGATGGASEAGGTGGARRTEAGGSPERGAPAEDAATRLASGEAWDAFCEALRSAGRTITGPGSPEDPFDRAEGFRYLARLTRAGLETFLEHSDPLAPDLHRPVHETVKIGADNPDNHYQYATVSGSCEYRIRGVRNSVHYLDFATQTGGVATSGDSRQTGHLEGSALETDAGGRFEIAVASERRAGNWLPMERDTTSLIVRQTFLDREREAPAELSIERVGGDGRPTPLTAERVEQGLRQAGGLVVACASLFSGWAQGFRKHVNELPEFDRAVSMGAGGDPNIVYYHSYWELGPDEALVIEATPPACSAWNFQLNNHWMESLDYRWFRIHVNKHTAVYRDDGSVRIVVAHEDPGLPNWIHTAGHRRGTMCFRWIGAEEHPQPRSRVVPLRELAG